MKRSTDMANFWQKYWSGVLTSLTVAAVIAMCSGLYMGFQIWNEVKEIDPMIERLDYMQQRQQQHEAALIRIASHTEYDIREMLEILNNAPYRGATEGDIKLEDIERN